MEAVLDYFVRLAGDNAPFAYLMLFVSAFVENVFPPIPGDTVTLIGAYFVGRGSLSFAGVLLSTTAGSVMGFMTLFLIALKLEKNFIEQGRIRWINPAQFARVEKLFRRFGYWIIAANRFLSGIRSVISISAGLSRLNATRVALLSFISALVWNGAIIFAGAYIGKSWVELREYIGLYNRVILIALGGAVVVYLVYYLVRKKKKRSA